MMKKSCKILFAGGLLGTLLLFVPALLLGRQAIFTYHDQLDGEMIAYILQARHWGEGDVFPEFMGGMWKTALTPPAIGCVFLFRMFSPLTALFLMQIIGALIGFAGMFFLVHHLTKWGPGAFVCGMFYGMLPFLPVYGLSQYGLPMLFFCVLLLQEKAALTTDKKVFFRVFLPVLLYVVFYAVNSSLVLIGFAVVSVLGLGWLFLLSRKESRRQAGSLFACILAMVVVYGISNASLIGQVLGLTQPVTSHKAEYVLTAQKFRPGLREAFLYGGQHSNDYHPAILVLAGMVLIVELAKQLQKKGKWNEISKGIVICLLWNLFFAVISALWNGQPGVRVRVNLGALGAFQLDRFLWIAPCFWYVILGLCLVWFRQNFKERAFGIRLAVSLICVAVLGMTGFTILKNSDVKSNLQKLRNPSYPLLSYSDYYALGVMEQVENYIESKTGLSPENYRVVSLGIDPAAALYHGFYCLDGYSNHYDLEYKHAFREIIAPALSKSEYLRDYFDNWGNRCYLFGTECPGYYTIEKKGFYFEHLEIDTGALRKLGGDYLFSAAYIANSEELGLRLLKEEPFETEDSYYQIYLYEVADE